MAANLQVLREELELHVAPLEARHAPSLQCRRGCSDCCVDDLRIFGCEAEPIRQYVQANLRNEEPHPPGACAFLAPDGACRIYPVRPYVCRTQGLPLRWFDDGAERRDVCPLNEPGLDLLALPGSACFELGPFEGRLAELERRRLGRWPEPEDRVELRALFRAS